MNDKEKEEWFTDDEEDERRLREAEAYDGLVNAWEMAGFD